MRLQRIEASNFRNLIGAIEFSSGLNVIYGLGGNDTITVQDPHATTEIYGGDGDDTVKGSLWVVDYIEGGAGNDSLYGYWGNDTILGGDGNDRIDGGAGDDLIYTGGGDDTIQGGYSNDTIYVGPGTNKIDGGPGTDSAVFAGDFTDYALTTAGSVTTITFTGGSDGDLLQNNGTNVTTIDFQGDDGADTLTNVGSAGTITFGGGSDGDVLQTTSTSVVGAIDFTGDYGAEGTNHADTSFSASGVDGRRRQPGSGHWHCPGGWHLARDAEPFVGFPGGTAAGAAAAGQRRARERHVCHHHRPGGRQRGRRLLP